MVTPRWAELHVLIPAAPIIANCATCREHTVEPPLWHGDVISVSSTFASDEYEIKMNDGIAESFLDFGGWCWGESILDAGATRTLLRCSCAARESSYQGADFFGIHQARDMADFNAGLAAAGAIGHPILFRRASAIADSLPSTMAKRPNTGKYAILRGNQNEATIEQQF